MKKKGSGSNINNPGPEQNKIYIDETQLIDTDYVIWHFATRISPLKPQIRIAKKKAGSGSATLVSLGAARAGVENLGKSLAIEWAAEGVREHYGQSLQK